MVQHLLGASFKRIYAKYSRIIQDNFYIKIAVCVQK